MGGQIQAAGNGEEDQDCEEDSFEENERIDLSVSDPLMLSPNVQPQVQPQPHPHPPPQAGALGLVVPDVLLRKDTPVGSSDSDSDGDPSVSDTDTEMTAGLGSPRVSRIRTES